MEEIFIKLMNYWITEEDDSDPEHRSLTFHPDAIKEMHDALDIEEPSHDGAYPGTEGSGQVNDYHLLDICPNGVANTMGVPIDWKLINIIRKLNYEGIETYGCDQGGIVPPGKVWEFTQWDYNGTKLVAEKVKLNSGEAKYGFISFNMEHESVVLTLFSKLGLKAAC